VGASWRRDRQTLWRSHSDAVNLSLLSRWLQAGKADCVLKTDLFDEMCSEGLYQVLATHARTFVGIDLSSTILRGARSRHEGIQCVAADVQRLPFADAEFDLIVSTSTLDHFESGAAIAQSLAELFRILRRGGHLIITMDNPTNQIIRIRNALPFRLRSLLGITPYYVGATCNAMDLQDLLIEAGFGVLEITTVMHCPRVFAVAVACLLERCAPQWLQRGFLRILMAFERLERLPTHRLTGHFTAIRALKKTSAPSPGTGASGVVDHAM
jgi:SAM-dependent methyltransferase